MEKLKRGFTLIFLIATVVVLSFFSSATWGGKPEKISPLSKLERAPGMTVREFAARNGLTEIVARKIFKIKEEKNLLEKVETFGLSESELLKKTNKALSISQEYETKNWYKIPLKFALWVSFLVLVFFLFKKNQLSGKTRIILYLAAVTLFGVIFGSDPSPMGTVKDAVVLYGKSGAVFPPRMIALTVFIILTIIANKFICSWGCQFGTLQDLIFRINRDKKDVKGFTRQIKIPFYISNGFRIFFFVVFSLVAVFYAYDIVEIVDPFKIFNPSMLGLTGVMFLTGIAGASLFIYRPWCHLFCPFGLLSWIFEKMSIFKIQVNYDTCIACGKCEKACPTYVMNAILKREKLIPDCFSCGTCINVCPTGSISLIAGTRKRPPAGKFKNKKLSSG